MARQRQSPVKFARRPQRVAKNRSVKSPRPFIPHAKHKKGEVIRKPSLVRSNLQKVLGKKPVATPLTDSDDSDGLVTKRKNAGKVANPIYASGAVAKGDTPGVHPSRKRKSMHDEDRAASAEKRRRITQGSGLKRPSKSSLKSPLAPLEPNSATPSSFANLTMSSPSVPASTANSILRPNLNSSILPATETSIIGAMKPRKRQPSILQIIETHDLSNLNDEDENKFLPDDESTPLPVSETAAAVSTPGSSLRRPNKDKLSSSGLRRPTSASMWKEDAAIINSGPPLSSPAPSPELPRNSAAKQTPARSPEDSVMAPPVSSSPEDSPPRSTSKTTVPKKGKKQDGKNISAKALQTLMPYQPKRSQRQRKQPVNEFDIPEDSQGSQAQLDGPSGESDNSPFKPQKKAGRKTARHRRTTSVLSDATNRSKNVRGAASKAKANNAKGSTNTNASQSGGARHLHTTSGARSRADKENTPLLGGTICDELQAIRDKFAEIDDWDMEFEEVEVDSSQAGYR
jgi:hypothetical protein